MPGLGFPILGTWAIPKRLQTTTTAWAVMIPPYMGQGPQRQGQSGRRGITHVKKVCVTVPTASAAVSVYTIMRPLNWAVITTAVAKATASAVLTLDRDPGLYATAYRYSCDNNGIPASVADNAIAAADYVAFQLADGTWTFDLVASGSGTAPVLTTTLPNPTGAGGIAAGTILYFFGVVGDKDPATGNTGYATDIPGIAALTTRDTTWSDEFGIAAAIHHGDPLLIYNDGASSVATLEYACGYYADF